MCTILPDYDVCLVSKSRSAPGSGATTPVTSTTTQESRSEEGLEKKLGMLSMWLFVLNLDSVIFETCVHSTFLSEYIFNSFYWELLIKTFLLLQSVCVKTDIITE